MTKRSFVIIISIILIFSLISLSEGFDNDEDNFDPLTKEPITYTLENVNSGRFKGGHDTITAEGMLLKKEVHKDDIKFQEWANNEFLLPALRTGAHDEDTNKRLDFYLKDPPIGPNDWGDFSDHFYNPDTGKGLKGDWGNPAPGRAVQYISEIGRKYFCSPGGSTKLLNEDKKKMYDYFGRILHLIQDMGNPAHTKDDLHVFTKTFEDHVRDNWSDIVNSENFIKAVTGEEYLKGNYGIEPGQNPVFYPDRFIEGLARKSKDFHTDGLGKITNAQLQENVDKLIPETIKYTGAYINAMYDYLKEEEDWRRMGLCENPPDPTNPAGDHPDDRFDVSDEFYWEKEFALSGTDLTDLYLRTAVKKGKIGVWYKSQFLKTFIEGRGKYQGASQEVKAAIETKFQELGKKLEQRPKDDWKGAPDIALFTNGFYNPSISLMLKIGEPVSFQDIDFNPEILKDHPVMLVPSGGFYGLSKSDSVKALLDEYVKNGGILVAFTQQFGSDWGLLPTPEDPQTGLKKPVAGYGYQEDQSCQFNSVYIDTYHPMLSGFFSSTANIGVDGYFSSYPDNSTVLLRRTANGQPAMILYPYGKGYVIATTLYTDFALSHSQANQAEINLVQNIISWAKKPDTLLEAKPGAMVSVPVSVTNFMDTDTFAVKFTILDPFRAVLNESTQAISIAADQTVRIPFSYPLAPNATLGIYHIDYTLLDGQGNVIQPQAETDSGRFVVSNPPQKYTSAKPIWFTVSTSSQGVLFGASFDYTFHVFNNTNETRGLIIRANFRHTARNREWKITVNPNQESTISGTDLFIDSWWFFETMAVTLYDESMKQIGSYELSFKGTFPSANCTVNTDKTVYGRGGTIVVNSALKNNTQISWQSDVKVIITDTWYNKVFEETKSLTLPPYGSGSIGTSFTLPTSLSPGTYTVSSYGLYGGSIISSSSTRFDVLQSQITVTPNIPSALVAGPNTFPFTVTNSGKIDVSSGTLNFTLRDPDGGIFSSSQAFAAGISKTGTLNLPVDIASLKFGTYTLTYSESDETRERMPVSTSITFSNNATLNLVLDKPTYSLRQTANLTATLGNTGSFVFDNVSLKLSVPVLGYTDNRSILLSPNQSLSVVFSIPIGDAVIPGQHSAEVAFTLPSGDQLKKTINFSIPDSELVIRSSEPELFKIGETLHLRIENQGGVDTTFETEKLAITDRHGVEIFKGGGSGPISAGEEKAFSEIPIPPQAGSGPAYLDVSIKDTNNGRRTSFSKALQIDGMTASLQAATDQQAYFKGETIAGSSTLSNGPYGIAGGRLRLAVIGRGGAGKFSPFLPQEGGWPFSGYLQVAVAPDGSVYVADSGNKNIKKFDGSGKFLTKWERGTTGDDLFQWPAGIAAAPDGSIFVADSANSMIQKFDPNGSLLIRWGLPGADDGEFYSPNGIALGPDGSVYVADTGNHRIQRFDGSGKFIAKWGAYGVGDGQFGVPEGIAIGSDGSVYITDFYTYRIQKFDRDGKFVAKWGSYGGGNGQFRDPRGISIGPDGLVYVVDWGNDRIVKFDVNGNFMGQWGNSGRGDGQFVYPENLAFGPGALVYVADSGNYRIQKLDLSGNFIAKWGSSGTADGQFQRPNCLAVAPDGSIYVADSYKRQIQKFDGNGDFLAKWVSGGGLEGEVYNIGGIAVGSDGSVYVSGGDRLQKFDARGNFITKWAIPEPAGIAVGPDGSVYVVDPTIPKSYNIQKFDGNGNFLLKWGESGSGDGQFECPTGVAVGSDGSVYIADTCNNRIQKFDPQGKFLAKWGTSGNGDGQFNHPAGIAVGPDDSIFVADLGNDRIQMFDRDGNFMAKWGKFGIGDGEFDHPSDVALGADGLVYVADAGNIRIQRMKPILFESNIPIDQSAATSQNYPVNIGVLNASGKFYLEATLTSSLGQTIAQAAYPFYLYEGNTAVAFDADKTIYKPGEKVVISGRIENRAPVKASGLTFSLSAKQGAQSSPLLDSGTFDLGAGEVRVFSIETTAGAEGTVDLTGKLTQIGVDPVEITDQYEVAKPGFSVSVLAPEVAGKDPFSISAEVKNTGKVEAATRMQFTDEKGLVADDQSFTLSPGGTKLFPYTRQITADATYTFSFIGDLNQIISKTVVYGLAADILMDIQPAYPEGRILIPVTVNNTGQLAQTIEVNYDLSPPASGTLKKTYSLPARGSTTDFLSYDLAEGSYFISAASQMPAASFRANFVVRKENKVETAISIGSLASGSFPVDVALQNAGYNIVEGSLLYTVVDKQGVAVWNGEQPISPLSSQGSENLTFNFDPSAMAQGDYTLQVALLNNSGQRIAVQSSSLSITGPAFQITQIPPVQTLMPGEEATFAFKVKNTGNQEGAFEFHFKAYDLLDVTRREWLKAREERSLDFAFLLPADLEEKDYFVDYELKGGERGQVKYHLAGINLAVSASLDKPFYNQGETARLSLSVSPSAGQPLLNLFARVNYPGYESKQPFTLNGPQALLFDVPLPAITGEKLFYGIYHESGRSIHLNSLYVYKAGDVLTLKTDKQVYKPGETVVPMVSSQQMASGTLTLSAPNYEEAFSFSGNAQKNFVLPAVMTAGTYFITYRLSGPQSVSGSQPFDVDGIQVKVKKAILDKAKYASSDTMNLNLTVESNQDLPATLKTWVVDPEKNYSSAGTQGITLTGAQPLLAAQSSAFSTTKLGIHRLVYGIYKDEMLLCSGSYAFDVGEAVLLGVSTDRADYPQGNEPIAVEAKLYGTVPGSLEFSLDGQSVGNLPVSPSGFSTTQYTPPEISPGLHTLKASLTSGGLTSSKQITFVYGSSLPDLSVRVNSDPNIKDGFMTITITVTNQGKSASIPTTLGLYDGDKLLAILDVKGLQSGESKIFTYSMNVLGRAGANSLVSRIDPGNKVFEFSKANNEANLSFAVPDLSLAVSLDKTVYGPGETAVITSSIYNLSKDPLPGLTLATEVKDAQGAQIFNKAQILPTLEGQNSAMIQTLWLTDAGLKEGVYSVSQTVQGKVATQATVSVAIKDFAKGLEGTITVQPNPVNQGSEETFSYTVTNKGSVDLSGLTVKALVINPDTGEVRKTYEKVVDLAQNGTISGTFSASTAELTPGVYNAVLQVSSAVILTPKALGSVIFEVKAAVPMISWAKTYGGDHNGVAYSIQQTLDGGYIAAGATGTLFPMNRDAWVRKLDGKGDIQWQKAYGSGLGDAAFAVQPTTDGGYVVAGETNGILGMGRKCWVFKLDFNGEIQWQKTYGDGWARSIQQTSEGGYIVTGAREEQAWLMKLDEKGEIQWQKAYGSLGDGAYSVQQTADGGFVVAGETGSERSPAAWVGKLDAQGEVQWQKTYGDRQGEVAYSIQQTTEGGYIIAGVTSSFEEGNADAWVLKIDAHGEIQWQKAYGGQRGDAAYSIHQTPDNGYIVIGVTNSFGNGDYDAWVLKLDADGEVEWQKAYGGQHGDAAFAIQQAKEGGYIVAGGTNSFGDHDYDVWLWKLDEKGEILACQEGWRKSTNVRAREATADAIEEYMKARDTHVLSKESHARVKQMQGWANDVCVGIPHISLDPSSRFLTFFGVKVGYSSTTTITVFNRGTGDLKIESIKVSGAAFTQKNDCAVLPPGHSCAIAVTFKPTAPGPMNATLEIYSNDPDEKIVRFNLLGTGR